MSVWVVETLYTPLIPGPGRACPSKLLPFRDSFRVSVVQVGCKTLSVPTQLMVLNVVFWVW